MRIKIIGDNNCARATRHLLRLAGFAVTEFLPADALAGGPLAGYAITIDLAPAPHTPDACLRPDPTTHQPHTSASEEAPRLHRDASSPAFAEAATAGLSDNASVNTSTANNASVNDGLASATEMEAGVSAAAPASFRSGGGIHFDSVDSALEAAVLRHVTQLAAAPVIVDRPGGVVHSDRELRIVAPNTGDTKADEAAAVAIEFGVLRGLLDLSAGAAQKTLSGAGADVSGENARNFRSVGRRKKWWLFGILFIVGSLGVLRAGDAAAPGSGHLGMEVGSSVVSDELFSAVRRGALVGMVTKTRRLKPALLAAAPLVLGAVKPEFAEAEPQGQFATGQGIKITDGSNFLVVDPCKGQTKSYASISQTANTQLVTGTAAKKIYVCSIHVVAAAAADVAVVEGTGTVCATGTAGVSGFGGATAATGWNFAANGGIVVGNGDSSLGAEGTSGDNLCIFNSGSGQVSGGISYVVQ